MLFSTHVNIAIEHIPKSKIIYSVKNDVYFKTILVDIAKYPSKEVELIHILKRNV